MKQISTVFFDRDGIINDVVMRGTVVGSPRSMREFAVRPDFCEMWRSLPRSLNTFVVSNQPDISRNLLDRNVLAQMSACLERFNFREIAYCMHDDIDGCSCRKPKPGLIVHLLEKYRLDKSMAVMIGDSDKDIMAGKAAGISTVLVRREYNFAHGGLADFVIEDIRDLTTTIEFVRA